MENILQYLNELNIVSICFRLLLALFFGGLIGIDRERTTRSAGFRTHALVCIGATLVMLIGTYAHNTYGGDVSRLGAQVINGIGFLGAGTIMISGASKVRGLTTAAALWTCACIGLAIGIGFYEGAFAACIFSLLLLKTLKVVDTKFREREHFVDIYLELYSGQKISKISDYLVDRNIKILSFDTVPPRVKSSEIGIKLLIKVKKVDNSNAIVRELQNFEDVSFAHKVYF